MAGVTDAAFRGICRRMGADLTYTEMVGAKALHFNPDGRKSRALLTLSDEEVPCAIQIFGADPEMMARQAARLCENLGERVALVDINMGCPVAKVVSKGEGSALMRTPDLAAEIVARVVGACPVPVTVKMRKGWDASAANAVEFARAMEAAGASAVAVHGRTRDQFYRGHADWSVIAAVKAAVGVPVVGSGDVLSARDVKAMLDETGADAVMIARGALGDPWIFQRARALVDGSEAAPEPSYAERVAMARAHAAAFAAIAGEQAYKRMRKHVGWYTAGLPGATRARDRANAVGSNAEMDALLGEYLEYVRGKRVAG
jgi:tRNA-dihydrouridine synthase B